MSLPAEARQRIRHARDNHVRAKLADELEHFQVLPRRTGRRRTPTAPEKLAARRREVVVLRAQGVSYKAIADLFGVCPRTVRADLLKVTQGDGGDVT